MSDDATLADANLAEIARLRGRILEWEDCYDRLAGAFDLHMDILECKQALADLAGSYYDVVLGEMAERAEKAETARRAWTELGAQAQADALAIKEALEYRHTCERCGGKGVYWTDVNGEAESEVCDCYIRADHVLYHEEHPGAQLLTELEDAKQFRKALDIALAQIDAEHDLTKALLIRMRTYIMRHGLLIGECVAWMQLKTRYRIGESVEADDAWLRAYERNVNVDALPLRQPKAMPNDEGR